MRLLPLNDAAFRNRMKRATFLSSLMNLLESLLCKFIEANIKAAFKKG